MNRILCFFGIHNVRMIHHYGKGYPRIFGLYSCACGKRTIERKPPQHPAPPFSPRYVKSDPKFNIWPIYPS